MNYFRRFLCLGLLVASLSTPARAAAPFRLFELAATRFSAEADGRAKLEYGLLNSLEQFRVTETFQVAMPPGMPAAALGKLLVSSEAWFAFQSLGPQALANFERINNGVPHIVAGIPHYEVAVSSNAISTVGKVVNLSTRGTVARGSVPSLIGGFVIAGQAQRVLIRAIGPGLGQFNVSGALPDPFLSIQRGNLALYFNGGWGTRPDADEIAQTAVEVGAFPLARSSEDAALLVELPPGAYTAGVVSESGTNAGEALLEIYVLP
jgi:hypothetical protein